MISKEKINESILYIFFGVLTSLVNFIVFSFMYYILSYNNVISNIISWLISVVFAFFTNKFLVFHCYSCIKKSIIEFLTFFISRLISGIIEVVMMFCFVDILNFHALLIKIILLIFIVIMNYLFSGKIIFSRRIK